MFFVSRNFPETYEADEVLSSRYLLAFRVRNIGLSPAVEIKYRTTCEWREAGEQYVPKLHDSDKIYTGPDMAASDHAELKGHTDKETGSGSYPVCLLSIDFKDSLGKLHRKQSCWTTTIKPENTPEPLELEPCPNEWFRPIG